MCDEGIRLEKVKAYAVNKLTAEVTAHDFSHSLRVMKLANYIGKMIGSDIDFEVINVAGLTHDIIDRKVAKNIDEEVTYLSEELIFIGYKKNQVNHVLDIIKNMSYSSGKTPVSLEGKVVQDADRLESMGALAIARTFAYGGKLNRLIYSEGDNNCSISHFSEKLLLLKDKMNTEIGKKLAISRHKFMEEYLKQFFLEVNLEDINDKI